MLLSPTLKKTLYLLFVFSQTRTEIYTPTEYIQTLTHSYTCTVLSINHVQFFEMLCSEMLSMLCSCTLLDLIVFFFFNC